MAFSEEAIQAIEKEISCIVNSINKLVSFQTKLDKNQTSVKKEIIHAFESLMSAVNQREAELLLEMETSVQSQQGVIQSLIGTLQQKLGHLQLLLQLAKEGIYPSNSSSYLSDNEVQMIEPIIKFQSGSRDNLEKTILNFGSVDQVLESEASVDKSDISKWLCQQSALQNNDCSSEDHLTPSDFVLLSKGFPSSPSVISVMELDTTYGLEMPSTTIRSKEAVSVCRGDEICCECKRSSVDVESLYSVWLKKGQDIPESLSPKQAPSLTMPKTADVCIANEKCKSFDQCLCDENCAVKELKQQLENLNIQTNHNHLLDTVNETIKESLLKDEEKNDENMWLITDTKTKNEHESKDDSTKDDSEVKNMACKRKHPTDDELTSTWLLKSQRVGSNPENEHCRKFNFTVPECNWLKKESKHSISTGTEDSFLLSVVSIPNKELEMWLSNIQRSRHNLELPVSTNYWLKQSRSLPYPIQKKGPFSVLPEQAAFFSCDVNMWLAVKTRC